MSGPFSFMLLKSALMLVMLGFAVRELWLLRHGKDDPELTRRFLRVMGGAERRVGAAPPRALPQAPEEEEEPEPLRRAA